ncbi:alcohol dehydrogenase GroES domain protein [Parafrankia sp. EAN1pec]|nr:alcohol dehydrogenase GroES domain protein [Frankia sp. EAN1pec]
MVSRAGVSPGDAVAVLGIGGIGISSVQGARIAGARLIFASTRWTSNARGGLARQTAQKHQCRHRHRYL